MISKMQLVLCLMSLATCQNNVQSELDRKWKLESYEIMPFCSLYLREEESAHNPIIDTCLGFDGEPMTALDLRRNGEFAIIKNNSESLVGNWSFHKGALGLTLNDHAWNLRVEALNNDTLVLKSDDIYQNMYSIRIKLVL